jgi:Nuclease-related domain
MDIQKIILVILILVIIVIVALIKKRRWKKEINKGEEEVNEVLEKIPRYKLLSDIMIKRENGTSQIDHVLIGKKGVFVIETKDYSGSIYGEQYSKYWTQVLNRNKNQFYNPIRQNYGHIKALEEYLGKRDIFISVIVFTNKSKLKKVKTETSVIQLKKLKKFIKKYPSDIKLSKEEIENLYNEIKKGNIDNIRARKKHVKRINRSIS